MTINLFVRKCNKETMGKSSYSFISLETRNYKPYVQNTIVVLSNLGEKAAHHLTPFDTSSKLVDFY